MPNIGQTLLRVKMGEVIPAITLLDLDGKRVSLEKFRGAPLLIICLRHLA